MSTDLYGVRVQAVAPDRLSLRLRVFVVYYEAGVRSAPSLPDDPAFFLRVLWDRAAADSRTGVPDDERPLARIALDQLLDEAWMAVHTASYVRRVDRVAERNALLDPEDEDGEHLHDHSHERHGGWAAEHRLVQADYMVRVTDPRWLAGIRPGRSWGTAWHPSPKITDRPREAAPSGPDATPGAASGTTSDATPGAASGTTSDAMPGTTSDAASALPSRVVGHLPATARCGAPEPAAGRIGTGIAAARSGDLDAAHAARRPLAGAGRTQLHGRADLALAWVALARGDTEEAVDSLRRVASGEDPSDGPRAAVALAALARGGASGPLPRALTAEHTGRPGTARELLALAPPDPLAKAVLAQLLVTPAEPAGPDAPQDDAAPQKTAPLDAPPQGATAPQDAATPQDDAAPRDAPPQDADAPRDAAPQDAAADRDADRDAARRLLTEALEEALESADPFAASYAGYLLGGMLADDGATQAAAEVLGRACEAALATRDDPHGLLPWIGTRLGELRAERDAEPAAVREAFEHAQPLGEIADPALATVGLGVLDGNPHAALGALERLRTWSAERYAQGCRLATRLGVRMVEESDDPAAHPLTVLLRQLDGTPESAAYGQWLTGWLRQDDDDWDGALDAWQAALDTDVLPYARWAGACRAALLTARGDEQGARQAALHGRADARLVPLADSLRKSGLVDEALVVYTIAAEGDDRRAAGRAAYGRAGLLEMAGETEQAIEAYRCAWRQADDVRATRAAFHLGWLLTTRGDPDGALEAARDAHRRAAAAGEPAALRARTAKRLGDRLRDHRDLTAARDAYQAAVDAWREERGAHYRYDARWALLYLGQMHGWLGEYRQSGRILRGLLEFFAEPGTAEEREIAVTAALALAFDAKRQRDLAGAEPLFRRVIDSGDEHHVPTAHVHLAELHYWLGDKAAAARHYERTLQLSDDPEFVAEGAYRLGEHLAETGQDERAREMMRRALDSPFAGFDPDARELLARLDA